MHRICFTGSSVRRRAFVMHLIRKRELVQMISDVSHQIFLSLFYYCIHGCQKVSTNFSFFLDLTVHIRTHIETTRYPTMIPSIPLMKRPAHEHNEKDSGKPNGPSVLAEAGRSSSARSVSTESSKNMTSHEDCSVASPIQKRSLWERVLIEDVSPVFERLRSLTPLFHHVPFFD